jgi:hypothetical protein
VVIIAEREGKETKILLKIANLNDEKIIIEINFDLDIMSIIHRTQN